MMSSLCIRWFLALIRLGLEPYRYLMTTRWSLKAETARAAVKMESQ